ncbi:MAG: DUF447 domain-containing protein [Candidatus Bathyarchaeia archaeon]|jgi:hypothetical protein
MVSLADLGFRQNTICETILCTFNPDGTPNAAPMGAKLQNSQQVILTIYNSAETLKNLQTTKAATLNLTGDIDVYYRSALKVDKLPEDCFEKSCTVNAPKLKNADATIALEFDDFMPFDVLRTKVTGNVKLIEAEKMYPHVYCRALPAVLEAIIHATRIKALVGAENEQAHVAKLYSLIQNCSDVVNRSAPDSHYAELMADLQVKLDLWRAKT